MDFGLCDGNYYDYENDAAALLREFDLADEVKEGECWEGWFSAFILRV